MFYWMLGIVAVFILFVISLHIDNQQTKSKKPVFDEDAEYALGAAHSIITLLAHKLGCQVFLIKDGGAEDELDLLFDSMPYVITEELAERLREDETKDFTTAEGPLAKAMIMWDKEKPKKKRGRPAQKKRGRPRKK